MPSVTPVAPLTHMPAPANVVVSSHATAGQQSTIRALPAASPGNRSLIIAGVTVQIDPTKHTPQNVLDLINSAGIAGVTASLDRYGQLIINGVASVTGDAVLLKHLGLA